MITDATGYREFVETLAREHTEVVEHDPVMVAATVIRGVDRRVDPQNGYTVTFGTNEFAGPTLYPTDVVAHSEQRQQRVDALWKQTHPGSIHDRGVEVYAVYTMALDLLEAAVKTSNDAVQEGE